MVRKILGAWLLSIALCGSSVQAGEKKDVPPSKPADGKPIILKPADATKVESIGLRLRVIQLEFKINFENRQRVLSALIEDLKKDYKVPEGWIIKDDGTCFIKGVLPGKSEAESAKE